MRKAILSLMAVVVFASATLAQQPRQKRRNSRGYPPDISGAQVEVYKTIGEVKLNIYIFAPENRKKSDRRAAIVFFFGGGWTGGSPAQFEHQCKYLASRGMVAMAADYRVASRHQTKALQCVADGKSAVRWIRANAERLGVDPERVAAGGGSAGGHVAACTGTIAGLDEEGEDTTISSKPDCMVLFNPALVLAAVEGKSLMDEDRMKSLRNRMGIEPEKLSPYHNVKKGAPPTIVFHGTGDTTVPYRTAEVFVERMNAVGNSCRLVPFEDRPHGFFNYGRKDNEDFKATVRAMDEFLAKQGFLEDKPTMK